MRSRDRRSRLASFAPRHPDFFNLYHRLSTYPPTHPSIHPPNRPHDRGFLVVSSRSPIRHSGYRHDRHLSPHVPSLFPGPSPRFNFATRTFTSSLARSLAHKRTLSARLSRFAHAKKREDGNERGNRVKIFRCNFAHREREKERETENREPGT